MHGVDCSFEESQILWRQADAGAIPSASRSCLFSQWHVSVRRPITNPARSIRLSWTQLPSMCRRAPPGRFCSTAPGSSSASRTRRMCWCSSTARLWGDIPRERDRTQPRESEALPVSFLVDALDSCRLDGVKKGCDRALDGHRSRRREPRCKDHRRGSTLDQLLSAFNGLTAPQVLRRASVS